MNRRQFLGRFFQAVATVHNSKSIYGLYHSWHQYQTVRSSLSVSCKYRYDNSSTNDLISFMKIDTIMALYDASGIMIWCSAYYKDGELINKFGGGISKTNLVPGTYTVKCLALGKGLSLGESGASMTITIPDVDRTTLPYNNYGYINNPTVRAEFIFSVSGIFFEAESTIESCGYYYPTDSKKGSVRRVVSPPGYAACAAVYNQLMEEIGSDIRYNESMYLKDIKRHAMTPIDNTYRYKMGPVYYNHVKVIAKYMESYGSYQTITAIDLDGYLGYGSAEYWNVCEANNFDYDPENNCYDNIVYDHALSGSVGTDGTYEIYYYLYEYQFFNRNITIDSVTGDGISRMYAGAGAETFFYDPKIRNVTLGYTQKTPSWGINGVSYRGTLMRFLKINTVISGDIWMYKNAPMGNYAIREWTYLTDTSDSIEGLYAERLPIAKQHRDNVYNNYFGPAIKNYGSDPGDGSPWVSVKNEQYDEGATYTIPIDALFGHISPDKSMTAVEILPSEGDIKITAQGNGVYDGSVSWGYERDTGARKFEYKPVLEGFTADLSDYDPNHQCNNPNMWIYADKKTVFMRQTVIPLDMKEIPDHQIT